MQFVPMGHEGSPLGRRSSQFVDTPHVFQNMGDGTYSHSGILAIRAAVAAKANITYKVLYNDAVAMTGGQPVEQQHHADRHGQSAAVRRRAAGPAGLRPSRAIRGVSAAAECQRASPRRARSACSASCARSKGVSGIVYEQTCATEKRRRRKRRLMADPDKRVFINPGGVRRLRRLLGAIELHQHPAARNRVRPQAQDRSVDLQQGLQLRERLLPVVRHGRRRENRGALQRRSRAPASS